MKKFLFKLVILCLPLLTLPFIIDPYNVFHYNHIKDNGVEPNKNYIKMRYILDNPGKFNAYLFGSSRVGGIDVDNIDSLHCYNMTYSVGLPIEHFENLEVMINRNIIPDIVLAGVDDIGCFVNPNVHRTDLLRMPYPKEAVQNNFAYAKFLIKYFTPKTLLSLKISILHNRDEQKYREQFYKNGGRSRMDDQLAKEFDWKKAMPIQYQDIYGIENALTDIRKIIDLCNKNNIRLIIFTNPLHVITYQYAVQYGYIDFLTRLSDITDYYNFSGINDVTTNNAYYHETSHYKLEVGDMVINTIFNNTTDEKLLLQGFGVYVTKDSRDAFIGILRDQQNDR